MKKDVIEEKIKDLDYKVKFGLSDKKYKRLRNQIYKLIVKEFDCKRISDEQEKVYTEALNSVHQNYSMKKGNFSQQIVSSSNIVNTIFDEENKMEKLNNVNKGWFKAHKHNVVILSTIVAGAIGIGGVGVGSLINSKKAKEVEMTTVVECGTNILQNRSIVLGQLEKQTAEFNNQVQKAFQNIDFDNLSIIPASLSKDLEFDINDNLELIERGAQFIARCRPCGIDMSESTSVSKFIDYIHTINYEQIDPMDYARYGYFTKTSNSIVENYQEIGDQLVYDLFSVTTETLIPYDLIIADKESAKVIMELQTLVAQYNEAKKENKTGIQKEIEAYLYDNFVYNDTHTFGSTVYEMVGRFGIIIDQMMPSGLPKDIMNKLSNDLYACGIEIPWGESHKSDRAQNETSIRTTLEEKLLYALNCRIQDLSMIPEIEQLLGAEVEQKIEERVAELNLPFIENPEAKDAKTTVIKKQTSNGVTLSNGQMISENEVKSLGLNPSTVTPAEYENAKKQQFEEEAKNEPGHTFTTEGGVTTSGSQVEDSIALTAQGTSDGYSDGNKNLTYNPKSNNASYLSGYNSGYAMGVADRAALEESLKEETTFVPEEEKIVEETEQVTEIPVVPTPEITTPVDPSQNAEEAPTVQPPESSSTFVPIENEVVEEVVGETVEESGYVEDAVGEAVEESGYVEDVTYSDPIAFNNFESDIQIQIANLVFVRELLTNTSNEYELSDKTYCMKI